MSVLLVHTIDPHFTAQRNMRSCSKKIEKIRGSLRQPQKDLRSYKYYIFRKIFFKKSVRYQLISATTK